MRRTTTILRIALGLALCAMVFALASCGNGEDDRHTHTYSSQWKYDEDFHWHASSCEHTTEINERAAHTFDGSECSVCGYTKEDPYKDFVFQTNGDGKILVSYNGTATDITIPHGVTSIGVEAFYDCRNIISVMIPNSVTSIGTSAFENCSRLTSVKIPDSVTNIGESAFGGCKSLVSITLPFVGGNIKTASDTYQYPLGYIFGTSSYTGGVATRQYYCGSSTSSPTHDIYYIPATLRNVTITGGNILRGAFYNCSSLTSITIPDSVTSIGKEAFYECNGLTYNQYDNFYYLGNEQNPYLALIKAINTSIATCDIHTNAKFIYDSAFSGCRSLTSITIPDRVTSIGSSAFSGCGSLTSITIPDRVTSIGSFAFFKCRKLMSVTIGNSVTSIGECAFYACNNLTSVTIGNSVTSIDEDAFDACYRLKEVYNLSTLSITRGTRENGRVGYYAYDVYTSMDGESKLSTDDNDFVLYTNGDEKTVISYIGTATDITIPNSVTNIGEMAFYDCDNLTNVTIPDGVTSICSAAFYDCISLMNVTIPNSVTNIGEMAFMACERLTSIRFKGTKDQWYAIIKDDNWDINADINTIICTNATISN